MLSAQLKGTVVNISKFEMKSPDFQLKTDGYLMLKPYLPMVLKTDILLMHQDFPKMNVKGQVEGDLKTLTVKKLLDGELKGELDVQMYNLVSELTWQGSAEIQQIPVKFLDKTMATNEATFDLSLEGEGDLDKINLKPMKLNTIKGSLTLNGQLQWDHDLQWDINLVTRQFDPSIIYPQWPGSINLNLVSQGRQSLSETASDTITPMQVSLEIQQLYGTLHEQALSGSGRIDIQGGLVQVKNLQLASGESHLNLDGQINQTLDLKWDIEILELGELVPEMSGLVKGQGQFTGTQEKPIAVGELGIEKLFFQNLIVKEAKLDFSLSSDKDYVGKLYLQADDLVVEDNKINNLSVSMAGYIDDHEIKVKSNFDNNVIKLKAKGGYLQNDSSWQGDIINLSLNHKFIGTWQKKESSKILLSPDIVTLDELCLYDKKAFLCTKAKWQSEELKADFRAGNVLLEKFKPWMNKDIEKLSGELNIEGKLAMKNSLKGNIDVELTPGVVSYRLDEQKKVNLKHQKGHITAIFDEQKSTANWHLNLDKHYIEGDLEIPGSILELNTVQTAIRGNLKLNIEELGLITAFIPQIKDTQGFIRANLKMSGTFSEPRIEGIAEFVSEKISIPMTGVEYSKVNITLKSHGNNNVDIAGQISSQQGVMGINGQLILDAEKNWPASMHLKGEHFQIVNLPEFQAIASPDFEIRHGIDGVNLKGVIDIPQAAIFLKELPEGSKSVSEDTIVLGEDAPQPANIDLDITLKLGDDIHIKGFGLDAWLKGKMRIKKSAKQLATANGELRTTHGTFRAYGQNLTIEQGRISYAGGYLDNPGLNIRASKEVQDVTVGVMATGTAKDIDVNTYSSDPLLSTRDIMSLLLTGQKLDNANNAKIYAGTELTDDLSVGVNTGVGSESSEFVVRYKFLRNLHFEGFNSGERSGGNLIYTIEIE